MVRASLRKSLGPGVRIDVEIDDIVAELLLRMDSLANNRAIRATTTRQLDGLIWQVLRSVVSDCIRRKNARESMRDQAAESGSLRSIGVTGPPLTDSQLHELLEAGRSLRRFDDRVMFFLVSRGMRLCDAATVIGCSSGYARVRWGRIRIRVRRISSEQPKNTKKTAVGDAPPDRGPSFPSERPVVRVRKADRHSKTRRHP
ncbi:MAG: hypothetical protein RLN60_05835 [Phycisphaerales bacterium]